MPNGVDLTHDEEVMIEVLLDCRKVQEHIWRELSEALRPYRPEVWERVFQKRVDKIKQIRASGPMSTVELRKRLLQQATLSINAIAVLDKFGIEK